MLEINNCGRMKKRSISKRSKGQKQRKTRKAEE
jgi:hypothetical protein